MRKSNRWTSRQYEHYAPAIEGRTDPPRYRMFIEKYLPPPPLTVLDCGCASGDITNNLSSKGYDVVGIDFQEMIEKAQAKHPNCQFCALDLNEGISTTIFRDIDWIYASEVMEHLVQDFEFLASCNEVLKMGGTLYLTVPRNADKWSAHYRFYPRESLKNMVWSACFKVVAEETTNQSTILICEKEEEI